MKKLTNWFSKPDSKTEDAKEISEEKVEATSLMDEDNTIVASLPSSSRSLLDVLGKAPSKKVSTKKLDEINNAGKAADLNLQSASNSTSSDRSVFDVLGKKDTSSLIRTSGRNRSTVQYKEIDSDSDHSEDFIPRRSKKRKLGSEVSKEIPMEPKKSITIKVSFSRLNKFRAWYNEVEIRMILVATRQICVK